MEVQQNILKKIKNDTNDLLKSQIFPSISELIEVKMKEIIENKENICLGEAHHIYNAHFKGI